MASFLPPTFRVVFVVVTVSKNELPTSTAIMKLRTNNPFYFLFVNRCGGARPVWHPILFVVANNCLLGSRRHYGKCCFHLPVWLCSLQLLPSTIYMNHKASLFYCLFGTVRFQRKIIGSWTSHIDGVPCIFSSKKSYSVVLWLLVVHYESVQSKFAVL